MGEPVGELAVVGQQQQPGRVGVEAADRVEPGRRVDQLDHRRPAARLARGRDDAGRLVDRPDLARLGADRAAVDPHVVALPDVPRRVGDDLAADGDPPWR